MHLIFVLISGTVMYTLIELNDGINEHGGSDKILQ